MASADPAPAPHGVQQQIGAAAAAALSDAGTPDGKHLTLLVIGKVTDSTARVLVEVLEGGRVTAHLTRQQRQVRSLTRTRPDGTAVQDSVLRNDPDNAAAASAAAAAPADGDIVKHTETVELKPGRPGVFKFSGLEPNARYALSFDGLAHAQPASGFVTMMRDWKVSSDFPSMRIATISCNLLSETLALTPKQTDLWQDLADRISRDEVDYVLHMGDQVYADEPRSNDDTAPIVSAFAPDVHAEEGKGGETLEKKDHFVFRKAVSLIKSRGATTPEAYVALHSEIEELYRELYRETWSHPPTAKCMANVPNLTVYDDHDFVDNWGTLPVHHDRSSAEFSVGLCARRVYYEYQASLHRDVAPEQVEQVEDDHHFHVFGEIAFAFTESRGAQSFRYEKDRAVPFLGVRQWADLEAACAPGGLFEKVKHLIMVCPCPVVYLPHGLNAAIEPMVEDAQGHWAARPFIPEQTRMLNMCLKWQERLQSPQEFAEKVKDLPAAEKPTSVAEPLPERGAYRTSYPSLAGDPVRNVESGVLTPSPLASDRRCTFVGGDVHVGGHTRLFKNNVLVMEQLVSSAIANHIIPRLAFSIASLVQNAATSLEDDWSFNHQPFTRQRNYGLVDTMPPEAGTKPHVVTHIISAD